jgi:cytochrome c oxidase cbb3-type subunit 4
MDLDHGAVIAFAKSYGLFYLLLMCAGVLVYVFWPSNKKRFDKAKKSIIDDEDKPWR